MKIEEKFNKRSAEFIEVQPAHISIVAHSIKLQFFTVPNTNDQRTISMYMTPDEALHFAEKLINSARTFK